jgi:hypothetical protein
MYNAVSATGDRIFFTAVGADDDVAFCGGEQPPVDELFAREEAQEEAPSGETRIVTRTVPISEPSLRYCLESPPSPCADGHFEGASQDGSKVFFTSAQKLVPGAIEGSVNLYEYDFDSRGQAQQEKLVLVSGKSANPQVQGVARASEDGSHVYFVAQGVLANTGANEFGDTAKEGTDNLYVFERDTRFPEGRTSFIARLSQGDASDWAREDIRPALASRAGRFLIFTSEMDITHEGIGAGIQQVFRYDAEAGTFVRASIGQGGYDNDGRIAPSSASLAMTSYVEVDSPTLRNSALAPDNGTVFFESAAGLTPQALNDQTDVLGTPVSNVYEYQNGMVYLISDGQDTSTVRSIPGAALLGYDVSGSDLFFMTSDSLIAQDTDTERDIYDARVDGGFPAPSSPLGCAADACQGPLSLSPPAVTLGGSETQAAGGDMSSSAGRAGAKPKPKGAKAKSKKRVKKARGKKRVKKARKATRRPLSVRGVGK